MLKSSRSCNSTSAVCFMVGAVRNKHEKDVSFSFFLILFFLDFFFKSKYPSLLLRDLGLFLLT